MVSEERIDEIFELFDWDGRQRTGGTGDAREGGRVEEWNARLASWVANAYVPQADEDENGRTDSSETGRDRALSGVSGRFCRG